MAAEQKARSTYEYLIQLSDDPLVTDTLRFLREREVVHYQRFGELLQHVYEWQDSQKGVLDGEGLTPTRCRAFFIILFSTFSLDNAGL
jgi:Mn-containing catalase